MLPTYSEEGKSAFQSVAQNAYKLFVYFEDADSELLYEAILQRLGIVLNDVRIICLSGKRSLLDQQSAESTSQSSKSLYILDKDFDDLLGLCVPKANVHYLERYSIENFFLELEALLKVVIEEHPRSKNLIELGADLTGYITPILPQMRRLSSLFLLAQEFSLPILNTSEPIQRWTLDSKPWELSSAKIDIFQDDVSALLILNGHVKNEAQLEGLLSTRLVKIDSARDIPGKQLVDLVRLYLAKKTGIRSLQRESFCYRLATKCTFESLVPLRKLLNTRLAIT